MRFVLNGEAKKHPEIIGLFNDNVLKNPKLIETEMKKYALKVKIETTNGDKLIIIEDDEQ